MSDPTLALRDLLAMNGRELHQVMMKGHALDLDAVAGNAYRGVDLSLPPWMNRLLWKTFVKEFVRDEVTGEVRGWNVRIEQTGVDGPIVPLRRRNGDRFTFGHYRVRDARGMRFPRGWSGGHYFDYRDAGNASLDVARFATTPAVSVNAGDGALLLGWEVFNVAGVMVPIPDYWALVREGPVTEVAAVPRARDVGGRGADV